MEQDYKIKYIEKKGKKRKIVTYANEEKRNEHFKINDFLVGNLRFSKFTKAYISKSSIYKNARAHMYNDIFIKYDIENFFNNIDHKLLVVLLHKQLNLVEKEKYSILEVSELISRCTYGKKGLPLGLITSPILANIYLKEFDNILYGKMKKLELSNLIYTRYADDLTISFKNPENLDLVEFKDSIVSIQEMVIKFLKKYKLKLNLKKKSIINFKESNHVRITGISVTKLENNNRRLSVGKKRINKLYDDALELYNKINSEDYILNKEDLYNISRIKGMQSFILSIHKNGYNHIFSSMMQRKLENLGFSSLNELINSLDNLVQNKISYQK